MNINLQLDTDTRGVIKKRSGDTEVVLSGAYFHCPKCNTIKPATAFGLRKMRDGTIRNQAWCKSCRKRKATP